jgi:hypothetical protein
MSAPPSVDAAPTLSRLVGVVRRNAGFRRLYTANAVSQVGDWLNVVALLSLLLELTGRGGVARGDQARTTLAAEREASEPESSGFVNLLGLAELREGARYVAGHPRVRALVITDSCFGLTLGGVLVLLAFFGEQVFARGLVAVAPIAFWLAVQPAFEAVDMREAGR